MAPMAARGPVPLCQLLGCVLLFLMGQGQGRGSVPWASPLEGKGLKPCMFSRIKLKTLERICVDPNTPWVRKLLQDLPKL